MLAALGGLQAEALLGRLRVGIEHGAPPHPGTAVIHGLRRIAHPRIHEHQAREAVAVPCSSLQANAPPKAVPHDERVVRKAGGVGHGHEGLGPELRGIVVAIIRIPHAGQVEGRHLILIGELGGDEIPPAAVSVHAMNQQEPRGARGARPARIGHVSLINLHGIVLPRRFHRVPKPLRNGHAPFSPR